MRRVDPAWLLVLLACLLGLALYLSEWVEVSEDAGFADAAMRNPFLAAEQFLARWEVDVESADGLKMLDNLPSAADTILLSGSRRTLSERRGSALLDWVNAGGRLIVVATQPWDENSGDGDRLLDPLGVRLHDDYLPPLDDDEISLADLFPRPLESQGCETGAGLTLVDLDGEPAAIAVHLHRSHYLDYVGDHEAYQAVNEVGAQLLYLNVGEGSLVVLTTAALWRNGSIGCVDHAHLLRWLTEDRPRLWWLFNTEMESLPALLWQRWPLAIILGLVLLGAWWWRSMPGLARPAPGGEVNRRELMEHVAGVARFRWQQGDAAGLLRSLRADVLAAIPDGSTGEANLGEITPGSGVSVERAHRALFEDPGSDSRRFLESVRTLQQLRQHLNKRLRGALR